MDIISLSNTLERMSMEDIVMALKDAQLKNQALQEENPRLLTTLSIPKPTRSLVLSSNDSATTDAGSSADNLASNTKMPSLLDSKKSQKELEYCAMKMVIFAHVWFERKGLFGIRLESARHELNAATLTNSLNTGMERPSPEQIMVLQLVMNLYKFLLKVFHPLASVAVMVTMFRTIYGVKILTCLLWGGTALDDQQIVTKGTNADLWHMTEVNPAAITFAAIVMHYLLVGDPEFALVGKKSGLNYMANFEYYIK
ncbi:hypothetical protein ARMGADRAFT_1087526 [Armillaria gallica]|uniref:Uncharacterized protein n=1 Tax=Armillaria gallica TaxID=47427 RepID=A0A2H3D1P8_ARMGA|nr:hypothetical protein ARMGADRAFT_1087526 [Armillaria gallica]